MKKFRLPPLPFARKSRKNQAHKAPRKVEAGVALADGLSGSTFLHAALRNAEQAFPGVFDGGVVSADVKLFKGRIADDLAHFESQRLASPMRAAVAAHLSDLAAESLVFRDDAGVRPLREYLENGRCGGIGLRAVGERTRPAPTGWFQVPFRGAWYRNEKVLGLVARLHRSHDMSDAAYEALVTAIDGGEARHELMGKRFAVLGAGAELAPTALLLEGGADVLWIDRADPAVWLQRRFGARPIAGRLLVADREACLLAEPLAVMAAIETFAAGGGGLGTAAPVHLGLFAYAPGRGRELRLTGVMDTIVRLLPPEIVASVAMYISPTTPGEVRGSDRAASERRRRDAPLWQKVLLRMGALSGPGYVEHHNRAVSRGVVALQGPTYQAAQYLTKMMSAEAIASRGLGPNGVVPPVSANVAGITATRSLEHPLFQAAFIGAPNFNINIFEPQTTRALSALLMLHDVIGDGARAQRPDTVNHRQIHGGVYSHPWLFDQTIRAGAVIGLSKRPDLLVKMGRNG